MIIPRSRSQIYFGWVIVGLAFCSLAFWFGIRVSFSVFYVALSSEFPWTPGALAGAQSTALIASTVAAPMLGAAIDRFGPRKVILPGILMSAAGLVLCASAASLFEFYLFYGVITGTAVTAIGIVTYSAVLRHWFIKKRGLASGITVSGMGVGILVFVPLAQWGISLWGWRSAYLILGAVAALVLFPASVWLLRQTPEEVGQTIDGVRGETAVYSAGASHRQPAAFPQRPLSEAMMHATFWYFMLFAFFAAVGVYIVLVHSVKYLVEQGTEMMVAATMMAIIGAISAAFRIIWGAMSDRIGRELTYSIGSITACLGIGSLLLWKMTGAPSAVYFFPVLFGIGWGVTAPSIMASSADIFDGRRFGFIFGIIQGVINLGGALGAWLGGAIFGRYQSYVGAFCVAIIALTLSCLFMWKAAPRRKSHGSAADRFASVPCVRRI